MLGDDKHSLQEEEQMGWGKSLKQLDAPREDKQDNQRHQGDHSDSSSLLHQLGRDLSISCLVRCSRSKYGYIAALNQSFRSLICSGELYRLRRQMGIVEHWIYFTCDHRQWVGFDPICSRWIHLPPMNISSCFLCSNKESLAVGTELLVFGREIDQHIVYKYSLLTNSWSFGTKTYTPRLLFGSASVGEIGIVAGGCDLAGNTLSSAELYNSETGTWVNLPNMNKARKMCSGIFMDGKFYVIGGIGASDSDKLTCGEMYDLESRTWHEIPNMYPRIDRRDRRASATSKLTPLLAVVKNELYAANYAQREVKKYDKLRNSWVMLGRLPERATTTNGWGLAFTACGDQVILIGGIMSRDGGYVDVRSWVPDEVPPHWKLVARNHRGHLMFNSAVMGC